jgi:hypothetical protein
MHTQRKVSLSTGLAGVSNYYLLPSIRSPPGWAWYGAKTTPEYNLTSSICAFYACPKLASPLDCTTHVTATTVCVCEPYVLAPFGGRDKGIKRCTDKLSLFNSSGHLPPCHRTTAPLTSHRSIDTWCTMMSSPPNDRGYRFMACTHTCHMTACNAAIHGAAVLTLTSNYHKH